jgi:hypothetical protein
MRLAAALVGGLVIVLSACAAPTGSRDGLERWDRDGVRFEVPAGWELLASTAAASGGSRRLLYLATQPMRDDCSTTAYAQSCSLPIDQLELGGVLIWWHTTTCAGPACALPDGDLTQVGGREATAVLPAEGCGQIGQTDASAYLVAVAPQRLDTIAVCSRDASAATLGELRAFLDAVEWRTP